MRLRLDFADGATKYYDIPSEPINITIETTLHSFSSADKEYAGLWYTDTKLFVEVVSSAEAYTLSSNGSRMINCKIDKTGRLVIDRYKSCKLVTAKIGDELFVQGIIPKVAWPMLKPIGRGKEG